MGKLKPAEDERKTRLPQLITNKIALSGITRVTNSCEDLSQNLNLYLLKNSYMLSKTCSVLGINRKWSNVKYYLKIRGSWDLGSYLIVVAYGVP